MLVVASVSYFVMDLQWRCPDETVFVTGIVFMTSYRIGKCLRLNVNYVSDAVEQMFDLLVYGISDKIGISLKEYFFPPSRASAARQSNNQPAASLATRRNTPFAE